MSAPSDTHEVPAPLTGTLDNAVTAADFAVSRIGRKNAGLLVTALSAEWMTRAAARRRRRVHRGRGVSDSPGPGMSEPSYRINTEREWSAQNPWTARITRLSDGEFVQQVFGLTEDDVIASAQAWIATTNGYQGAWSDGRVLFADEAGDITEGAAA